ncbi:M16 family metallopeptidase [Tenacibaculum geojense]|uniref:M16 family metallopeptidase n=1 Tax=Tenacibaculum geojense TaxID=915352 RepID=A0ABW3JQ85_9FLAO
MKKVFYAISFALLLSSFSYAQTSLKDEKGKLKSIKIPSDPSVKIGKLSNGLTYFIKQNSKPENKVELRLAIKAGSILEDDDQLGLAHFMEHMNFNGTKNFKKNELVDYLQSIGVKFGAHLNAYTSFDETVYILPIPSDDDTKLEKGFQILEDWSHAALLKGDDIDEERGVVLEEYRSRRDANSRMMEKYLDKVAYGSKYAKRLPIGTKENLENFKHESIRRFHKDWYRPDLMAVIVVGDAEINVLEKKIKDHFEKIPAVKNPRKKENFTLKNHQETFIAIEADKEAAFSRVQIMYKDREDTAPKTNIEDFRKNLINSLFDQMINNRFDELANGENPPFTYGYSFYGGTFAKNRKAFQSVASTSSDGQLIGLEALLTENERVKRYGFLSNEFERAKTNIIASFEKRFKDKDKRESSRITRSLVSSFLNDTPSPSIEWEFKTTKSILPSITVEEVNQLITNFLHDDNRVVVITGPEKKVTEKQVLTLLKEVKTKELKPYEDKVVSTSLIEKLPLKGKVIKIETNEKLATKTLHLSNGAKVTFKKTDFKNDEILFEAFSFGGHSLYSDDEIKKTAFANGGLYEAGVNNYSKNDLNKMMTGKIVRVNPYISTYSEGFRGMSTPKDLETLFQMVHLYFTSLNKDDKAFNSFVTKQKNFFGNLMANPNFYFQSEMSKFINNGNTRYTGFPSPEKYENVDYNLAYNKYLERFANAGDFNFYFVGNVNEKEIIKFAEQYLANLPGKKSDETYKVHSFRPITGSHTHIIEKGKDPKSNVRISYQGEADFNEKDALTFKLLGDALSIKLIEKLREKEAGVYSTGAYAALSKIPYGKYNLSISFPCGPENVEKLKTIAVNEVAEIVKNGPTDEDIEKAKKALILQHKEDSKKNKYWLSYIKNIDYLDNPDNFDSYEANINAITKKDIKQLANKYLTNGYILGILNPEK